MSANSSEPRRADGEQLLYYRWASALASRASAAALARYGRPKQDDPRYSLLVKIAGYYSSGTR